LRNGQKSVACSMIVFTGSSTVAQKSKIVVTEVTRCAACPHFTHWDNSGHGPGVLVNRCELLGVTLSRLEMFFVYDDCPLTDYDDYILQGKTK